MAKRINKANKQAASTKQVPEYKGDQTKPVFGLRIYKRSAAALMKRLSRMLESGHKHTCFFVNAHTINTMFTRPGFRSCLQSADLLLPDGIGVELATRWSGETLEENLCGTDLIAPLSQHGFRMFLLGSEGDTARRAAASFQEKWGAQIVGTHHGFVRDFTESQRRELFASIEASGANVLLVGMGVPVQEEWLHTYREQINVPLAFGVGGLFDYFAGNVKRAPMLWRDMRLEWLYRLIQEPRRLWQRYVLGNPIFILRLLTSSREGAKR